MGIIKLKLIHKKIHNLECSIGRALMRLESKASLNSNVFHNFSKVGRDRARSAQLGASSREMVAPLRKPGFPVDAPPGLAFNVDTKRSIAWEDLMMHGDDIGGNPPMS